MSKERLSEEKKKWLQLNYPDMFNRDIAALLGISLWALHYYADKMCLYKSKEFKSKVGRKGALIVNKKKKDNSI